MVGVDRASMGINRSRTGYAKSFAKDQHGKFESLDWFIG